MILVRINGKVYDCVSSVIPSVAYTNNYDVVTMDGKRHRETKGIRTSYQVVFFNKLNDEYDELKSLLKNNESVLFSVVEKDGTYKDKEYLVNIGGEVLKGKLNNGTYYYTGLPVNFEAVEYDS